MEKNQVLDNFVSSADLSGKEYYAIGFDNNLVDTDREPVAGIIQDGGQASGDTCVAVVSGETYAYVVVKAGVNVNVGDVLGASGTIQIDGTTDENGLLMQWGTPDGSSSTNLEPTTISTTRRPAAIALEPITADANNNIKQLIRVRLV